MPAALFLSRRGYVSDGRLLPLPCAEKQGEAGRGWGGPPAPERQRTTESVRRPAVAVVRREAPPHGSCGGDPSRSCLRALMLRQAATAAQQWRPCARTGLRQPRAGRRPSARWRLLSSSETCLARTAGHGRSLTGIPLAESVGANAGIGCSSPASHWGSCFRVNWAVPLEGPFGSSLSSSKAIVAGTPPTRARCVTNAGVSAAPERRRIGTASATDTSRRGVYSAIRRCSRGTRRESGATGASGPDPCWPRSRAVLGGHSLDVSGLPRVAPRHRDTPPSGSHGTPLGLAAAKPLLSASSVYAFSDHGPIVATFED